MGVDPAALDNPCSRNFLRGVTTNKKTVKTILRFLRSMTGTLVSEGDRILQSALEVNQHQPCDPPRRVSDASDELRGLRQTSTVSRLNLWVMQTLISKQSLRAFRDYLSSYTTLGYIGDVFKDAGVGAKLDYNPTVSGQRRTLVEQHYITLNLSNWTDVRLLIRAFEDILTNARKTSPEQFEQLVASLLRDGFEYQDGRIVHTARTHGIQQIAAIANRLDAEYLAAQVTRLQLAIVDDPASAIGTAKELLETCCKTVLADHGVTDYDDFDVPKLTKETLKVLKLTPENVPDTARGKDAVKKMLQGLSMAAQGLAELRNEYGTGHGKVAGTASPKPRHAALAVGAATTLATFLFDTHEVQRAAVVKVAEAAAEAKSAV